MTTKLPKVYAQLKDTDFPIVIGGIKYSDKRELKERYEADLTALAQLLYDIWQEKKSVAQSTLSDNK